jgi:hypothetical protein
MEIPPPGLASETAISTLDSFSGLHIEGSFTEHMSATSPMLAGRNVSCVLMPHSPLPTVAGDGAQHVSENLIDESITISSSYPHWRPLPDPFLSIGCIRQPRRLLGYCYSSCRPLITEVDGSYNIDLKSQSTRCLPGPRMSISISNGSSLISSTKPAPSLCTRDQINCPVLNADSRAPTHP